MAILEQLIPAAIEAGVTVIDGRARSQHTGARRGGQAMVA
ncbi:hypothetical protein GGR04_004806 [Aureimonas pseudogalii]|uniref:Uncharacterized protein n=1 Tax=Aureimonas pseudogalii TaxID=1744844 RepID=A0A7W6MMJ3_9HYPH|nr:hypothetical protein [Aureimonas pseudogalii]